MSALQAAARPPLPPAPDFKFSKVIAGMNEILANVGGSVEIKRKNKNGVVESIEDQEGSLKVADFRLKARATQHSMSKLSYAEKKSWIVARKDDGNKLYRSGKHEKAIEKYMEAVMGVAIGDSPSDRKDAIPDFASAAVVELGGVHDGQGTVWPWAFLAGRGRILARALRGRGRGRNSRAWNSVHLQYLKVYTRRSKCFIHIGFLNKAISDLKKV